MLKIIKRALLAASVAASGIFSVAPYAAHAAGPPSLTVVTPAAGSLAIGNLFNVTVNMNTNSTPITGWQFGLTYDSTIVELDNGAGAAVAAGNNLPVAATFGSPSFLDAFPAPNGTTGSVAMKLTALGTVQFGGQALSGQNAGTGSTGASPPPLATFQFKALANGTSPFTITNLKVTDVNAAAITGVTVAPTSPSITVGPVNAPNLVIQNATTVSPTTPAGNTFNVTFTVANTGTLASTAGSATVAITSGATPTTATVPVPAIPAGGNSGATPLTTAGNGGPFTLSAGSTLAQVTITDGSATATTAYSFAAFTSTGNTNIDGSIAGTLVLTPPSDVAAFVLTPNLNNTVTTASPMVIKSNLTSFSVTVAGTNNGFLTEFNAGAYVTAGKQLHNQLQVKAIATPAAGNTSMATFQSITGTPASFVAGTLAGQDPANGASFATTFNQFVGFNDPSVAAPHSYHEQVTFAAAGTF